MASAPDIAAAQSALRLVPTLIPDWTKLAWLAVLRDSAGRVELYHGSHVVVGGEWCVEAAWAGPFAQADFDQTDLVFGTGFRCRGNQVVFVTSGHTLDRLWYCRRSDKWVVSNSLPSLLAFTGLRLLEDHDYDDEIKTEFGVTPAVKSMPVEGGEIGLVWFDNLLYDGQGLLPVRKPDSAPHFSCFDDYYSFLVDASQRLAANMSDPARPNRIVPVASISSGYDSSAVAVVARLAGCIRSVTIRDSTSLWRGSDSGKAIAEHLGMSCKVYPRTQPQYLWEEAVWAAANRSGIMNWTQFEFPQPLALLFTGCYGDALWERHVSSPEKPLSFMGRIVLGLGEWRLLRGVLMCPVPFWGMRHYEEIRAITASAEMLPWTLHTSYDRPIVRRIVEQAGVRRGSFAVRKKDSTSEVHFRWPFSPECRGSFDEFARDRGLHVPSPITLKFLRCLAIGETVLGSVTSHIRMDLKLRHRFQWQASRLLFHWANGELASQYGAAMRAANLDIPAVYGLQPGQTRLHD